MDGYDNVGRKRGLKGSVFGKSLELCDQSGRGALRAIVRPPRQGTAGGREGNGREMSGQDLDRMARWHRDYIPEWKRRGVVESGRWGLISPLVTYQPGRSGRNTDGVSTQATQAKASGERGRDWQEEAVRIAGTLG